MSTGKIWQPFKRTGVDLPQAPPDIQDAVELFARKSGRTARLHFVPFGGWFARFELRCNDPRMKLYQEGRAEAPPTEDVWFQKPNPRAGEVIPGTHGRREAPYIQMDILQMGASGVTEFLERGDTWSGRGEHSSIEEAVRVASDKNKEQRAKNKADARERGRDIARDTRRTRLKIPFLGVGIDLRKGKQS